MVLLNFTTVLQRSRQLLGYLCFVSLGGKVHHYTESSTNVSITMEFEAKSRSGKLATFLRLIRNVGE